MHTSVRIFTLFIFAVLPFFAAASEVSGESPDFTLKSRSGSNIKLSEQRGQVVMINFWASWCGPCRKELPVFEEYYKKYKDLGFTVLAVNVDDQLNDANRFLKDVEVSFPVLYDTEKAVSELYSVDAMPTTLMVDKNGQRRFLHRGYKEGYEESYENEIKQLVME